MKTTKTFKTKNGNYLTIFNSGMIGVVGVFHTSTNVLRLVDVSEVEFCLDNWANSSVEIKSFITPEMVIRDQILEDGRSSNDVHINYFVIPEWNYEMELGYNWDYNGLDK